MPENKDTIMFEWFVTHTPEDVELDRVRWKGKIEAESAKLAAEGVISIIKAKHPYYQEMELVNSDLDDGDEEGLSFLGFINDGSFDFVLLKK